MNFTDTGTVCVSGQNPFMILFEGRTPVTLASFWRVELSPYGPGHALFVKAALIGDRGRVYTDNFALASYLQGEIYAKNPGPFSMFRDAGLETIEADFSQSGDPRSNVTEHITSHATRISLSWFDFLPAFKGGTAADPAAARAHTHYALYVPARKARLTIDDIPAAGEVVPIPREGREFLSAGLALAETWTRPQTP